jgi:NAD dependent epimerase/dehydratase family enzyme
MADALLLTSQRVAPQKLKTSGFQFKYDRLETALSHILR